MTIVRTVSLVLSHEDIYFTEVELLTALPIPPPVITRLFTSHMSN